MLFSSKGSFRSKAFRVQRFSFESGTTWNKVRLAERSREDIRGDLSNLFKNLFKKLNEMNKSYSIYEYYFCMPILYIMYNV